jgi:hypothetical protein
MSITMELESPDRYPTIASIMGLLEADKKKTRGALDSCAA